MAAVPFVYFVVVFLGGDPWSVTPVRYFMLIGMFTHAFFSGLCTFISSFVSAVKYSLLSRYISDTIFESWNP